MKKFCELITNLSYKTVWSLFGLFIAWLVIVCGNITSRINDDEHIFLIHDSIIINMLYSLLFFLFIAICNYLWSVFLKRKTDNDSILIHNTVVRGMLITIGIMGLLLVLCSQNDARADQLTILDCVNELRNHDFSCLNPGGYLDKYHNQYGIVFMMYYASFIFGNYNFIAFQLINVLALVNFYKYLEMLSSKIYGMKVGILVTFVGILFLPLIFYTNFVYGTTIGLSLSITALFYLREYFLSQKINHLLIALISCFIAILIKQNYLIFVIGFLLYCVLAFLSDLNLKKALAILGIFMVLMCSSILPGLIVNTTVDVKNNSGVSSLAFVAMGLQESSWMYNGWYNDYNSYTYNDAAFNGQAQSEIAKNYLRSRLNEFKESPDMALSFFAGKNASQWTNPDFQGLWINRVMPHTNRLERPEWIMELFSPRICELIAMVLDVLQFWILLGALIFIFLNKKDLTSWCLMTIFIGGFIFHTFWEAKSQYTLPYFTLLFPMTCAGWITVLDHITSFIKNRQLNKNHAIKLLILVASTIIVLGITSYNGLPVLSNLFAYDQFADDDYIKYLVDNNIHDFFY